VAEPVPVPVLVPVPPEPVPVPELNPAPVVAPPPRQYGINEDWGESGKVEAFADDTTPTGKLTPNAIQYIKQSLSEFAIISGLKCNVEKSQILITGTDAPVPDYILDSGFQTVNKVKILGFEISNDYKDLKSNFEKCISKIRNIITFWQRFRLSLSGRINVAKSLLLSQLTFHGSVILPSNDQLNTISELINNFISSGLKISKKAITVSTAKGGTGFPDLKEFLLSLQCAWTKRAVQNTTDCWRLELNLKTGMNPDAADPEIFDPDTNPILREITTSFLDFKKSYLLRNNNFFNSEVRGNPLIFENLRTKIPVKLDFFYNMGVTDGILRTLKVSEVFNIDLTFKTLNEIDDFLGTNLSRENYNSLKKVFTGSLNWVERNKMETLVPDPLSTKDFLLRFKKGSKPFRKVIENLRFYKIKNTRNNKIKKFFSLIELNVLSEKELDFFNAEWTKNFYPTKTKDFIYKFRNNLLGLNTRVSHFNAQVDRTCTFCHCEQAVSRLIGPLYEETFVHLFYSCTITQKCLDSLFRVFLHDINWTDSMKKKFLFLGVNPLTDVIDNPFINALSVQINFFIWECKLQKKIPVAESLFNDMFYSIDNMRKANNIINTGMNLNLHLCRVWPAESSRRR
jgi:hypothetical protein